MPVLKFRVYWEEDDSIYRDIVIKHNQSFLQFHGSVLQAFEFDNKHKATFFRSNDHWLQGREIILEKDDRLRRVEPLLMADTLIGSEVKAPNQKFIYIYDFVKNWTFRIELINVFKEENPRLDYPACVRKEGLAPGQYGTKGLVSDKLVEMEEKYDLNSEDMGGEGFGEEGEGGGEERETEDTGTEEYGEDTV